MNTKNMETSITSEMICRKIERPNKDLKFPEIVKNVPCTISNDRELDDNQCNEGITDIEQTKKI